MNPGDPVTVKIGRGAVQKGTVVRVLPEGRFVWANRCNYRRTSKLDDLTEGPEHEGRLDPLVKEWIDEDET